MDKESGDTLKREAFEKMQSLIFRGGVGAVVVWKLDRISRSLKDGLTTLCDWVDKGLRVVSVTQDIDFSGPAGRMIAAVLFGVAQMEQETRRERQAAGIAVAKQKGIYKGRKKGTTKAKPERARRLRDGGLTIKEICNALAVDSSTVHRYLRQTAEQSETANA